MCPVRHRPYPLNRLTLELDPFKEEAHLTACGYGLLGTLVGRLLDRLAYQESIRDEV